MNLQKKKRKKRKEKKKKKRYLRNETIDIVIFLNLHSTKQGLSLADSWSHGLD